MFTAEHWIWIGLCAVFITGMCLLSRKKAFSLQQAGWVMTIICVFSEVSKIMVGMVESPGGGIHLNPLDLPLHLCSLMLFVVFYLTFGKEGRVRRLLINFIAVIGTLGSFFAILIPTNGTDFASLPAYQCFVYHAGLLWFSLYLILSRQAVLGTLRSFGENLGLLLLLVFVMLYLNGALSAYYTNFFYLTRPPMEHLPYLNLNHGWYAYFLRLTALGTALIALFHLPFFLKARRQTRRGTQAAAS